MPGTSLPATQQVLAANLSAYITSFLLPHQFSCPVALYKYDHLFLCGLAVQKLLATAQPSIDFAWKKYIQAHDTIVVSCGSYKRSTWCIICSPAPGEDFYVAVPLQIFTCALFLQGSPYYHAYYNKAVDNGSFVLSKV